MKWGLQKSEVSIIPTFRSLLRPSPLRDLSVPFCFVVGAHYFASVCNHLARASRSSPCRPRGRPRHFVAIRIPDFTSFRYRACQMFLRSICSLFFILASSRAGSRASSLFFIWAFIVKVSAVEISFRPGPGFGGVVPGPGRTFEWRDSCTLQRVSLGGG